MTRNARSSVFVLVMWAGLAGLVSGQTPQPTAPTTPDKFRQLEEVLPTPNDYRTASGAPGHEYWQQQVDYDISVALDDEHQTLAGTAAITYYNRSPDPLAYVWLQLDANLQAPHSDANLTRTYNAGDGDEGETFSFNQLRGMIGAREFDGGIKIDSVVDATSDQPLDFTIVGTMMRVDLPEPLAPGHWYSLRVAWNYAINNARLVRGRTGYEHFPDDGNYLYELAQWYPRACAYTDATGWQHKQYLGSGEFTLEFGNYAVRITVPADHIVGATGVLTNPEEVLTDAQRERLAAAETAETPVFIVTPDEARAAQAARSTETKTWEFRAENVRDFAWASSRKFLWDAMGVDVEGRRVMAMSFYPIEGEPLWSRYSTHAIAHTLEVYSHFTFPYPYPVAISVNGPVGGMEYPMISFNGPRPEKDGTYSARTKYGLISVVIHEVGHNWFPMIVNTDERQWTWMDEGLNTYLQYLAEQQWEEKYPSRRGDPTAIIEYMTSPNQVPVMTASDSLVQFGDNAYAKPATALNILRETVLGRELFDAAFKQYANRWKFKRPMPADFFRTIEDASGRDLDWFWRGWFYSTDHVDLAIEGVRRIEVSTGQDYLEKPKQMEAESAQPPSVTAERNKDLERRVDRFPELKDFYNEFDPLALTDEDREAYERYLEGLTDEERAVLDQQLYFYQIDVRNVGGVVMPVIMELEFEDGSKEMRRVPAEVWRRNSEAVSQLLIVDKPIRSVQLDPRRETADADLANNHFPPKIEEGQATITEQPDRQNEMQRARKAAEPKPDEPPNPNPGG
jgi:hypothetical protein